MEDPRVRLRRIRNLAHPASIQRRLARQVNLVSRIGPTVPELLQAFHDKTDRGRAGKNATAL